MHISIILLLGLSLVACDEKLVFMDEFNYLNFKAWQHELTMSGGGNWEFEWYVNNRSNSYVNDSKLFLQPTFTEDYLGDNGMRTGSVDFWGGSPADACTQN